MQNPQPVKKVLIVGGGPVGLACACFLRQRYPDKFAVTIIEKRRAFERLQILSLGRPTLELLPDQVTEKIFGPHKSGCWMFAPSKDRVGQCYVSDEDLPYGNVITKVLEQTLQESASRLQVVQFRAHSDGSLEETLRGHTIRVREADQPVAICDFDVLVGADGARSWVRSEVLHSDTVPLIENSPALYGAVFNLKSPEVVEGIQEAPTEKDYERVQKTEPQQRHRFFRSQTGNCYIGLALGKEEYDAARTTHPTIPDAIWTRVLEVCSMARIHPQSAHVVKWFPFPIELQRSARFSGKVNDRPVYLVGDATATTHFFTGSGVNYGIQTAWELTDLLAKYDGDVPETEYAEALDRHIGDLVASCKSIVDDLVAGGLA